MSRKMILSLIIILGLIVTGCSNNDEAFEVPFKGEMDHIHGMGYAGNDGGLYFASHRGLKIYRDNKWFKTSTNLNDYMGFAAVDKGFYSSGHPGDRKSTRLNSSHVAISYAVFCLKKKKKYISQYMYINY